VAQADLAAARAVADQIKAIRLKAESLKQKILHKQKTPSHDTKEFFVYD
jgi:hypothetical protein